MNNANIDHTLETLSTALKDLISAANQPVAQEITQFLDFRAKKGDSNVGKGVIWSGDGTTKQIIFNSNPDRFYVTETVELGRDKSLMIGGAKILDTVSLGNTVVKSNLREVGRLKGLIVDGSISVNQYVIYNASLNRLGIGTETPNAVLSVADQGVEVMLGTTETLNGMVGTYATKDFDIVTGNTPRISVKANGDIDLGNPTKNPIKVKINGKLSVGVEVPDPGVDLHVAGAVRFNNKLHLSASAPPSQGTYNIGDIVWNDSPRVGSTIGWVCLRAGSPGMWYPFGEIKEQNK
jgi:hypothetical protein